METAARLRDVVASIENLQSSKVAHRLARYELAVFCEYFYRFLSSGSETERTTALLRLRRCVAAVLLPERRIVGRRAKALVESMSGLDASGRQETLRDLLAYPHAFAPMSTSSAMPLGEHLQGVPDPAADVAQVVRILRAVPRGLRRWVVEGHSGKESESLGWRIERESHVQALLWLVLSPVYEDLVSEVPLQPVGSRIPRPDFALPERGILIEAKFVRQAREFSKVTNEIAADVSLYLRQGSGYGYLIVFVWDDSRATERHDEFVAGLREMGVTETVVVSRPGLLI